VWGSSLILQGEDATRAAAFLPQQIEEVVGSQFPADTATWELLWRGNRDGFAASEFHARCDIRGATITVVQSESGHVFRGVTGEAWTSCACIVGTTNAFLYGIRTHGSPDDAVIFKATKTHNAMVDFPSYGPTFGAGHDLKIDINRRSHASLGTTYTGNGVVSRETVKGDLYFSGTYNFTVVEIEVYKLVPPRSIFSLRAVLGGFCEFRLFFRAK
jgi:hypothetical protein